MCCVILPGSAKNRNVWKSEFLCKSPLFLVWIQVFFQEEPVFTQEGGKCCSTRFSSSSEY